MTPAAAATLSKLAHALPDDVLGDAVAQDEAPLRRGRVAGLAREDKPARRWEVGLRRVGGAVAGPPPLPGAGEALPATSVSSSTVTRAAAPVHEAEVVVSLKPQRGLRVSTTSRTESRGIVVAPLAVPRTVHGVGAVTVIAQGLQVPITLSQLGAGTLRRACGICRDQVIIGLRRSGSIGSCSAWTSCAGSSTDRAARGSSLRSPPVCTRARSRH
jgi:hypothetical protein